ncbi:MAG: ABC transporter ATP-binding protein [Actinomycetes bacterium]
MIVFERLRKHYGSVRAVDNLSFEVRQGKVTALLGPNGAGKTTSLRILLGLTRPDSGSATFDGRLYPQLAQPIREVGSLIEQSTFHPGRTARTHLRALTCALGLPARRVDEVLAQVDLRDAEDRRVGGYSTGMRQRLGLAGALLGDPATLVLDEPQNGLDPQGTRWLRTFLRELADDGRTVLVSSHLLSEMEQLADDVVIVDHGRVVHSSPLAQLGLNGEGGSARRLEDVFLELTGNGAKQDVATEATS